MDTATSLSLSPNRFLSPSGGDGQMSSVTHSGAAIPAILLLEIQETHRQRQDLLRAELRLNNQIQAVYRRLTGRKIEERARLRKKASSGKSHVVRVNQADSADPADDNEVGGDHGPRDTQSVSVAPDLAQFLHAEHIAAIHTAPMLEARKLLEAHRRPLEKRMELLAKELPVWQWAQRVRGFGALGLAQIAGECGDLANYSNPAKVWKRMGLALVNGERQGKRSDPEEALAHGYSPQRRSIMYVIADSLMKGNRDGEYRTYYLAEKERQREKLPDAPAAHIDNRARRHLAKRLLRDLWRVWWACTCVSPLPCMPDHAATAFVA